MRDIGKETGFHLIQFLHLIYFHLFDLYVSIDLFPVEKISSVLADQDAIK